MSLGSISSENFEETDILWNLVKDLEFLNYEYSLEKVKPSHFRFPNNALDGDVSKFSEFGLEVIKNFLHIGLVDQDEAGCSWISSRVLLLVWPAFVSPTAYQNRKLYLSGIKKIKAMLYCVPKSVYRNYSEGVSSCRSILIATAILAPAEHWKYLERMLVSSFYKFIFEEPTVSSIGNVEVWENHPIITLDREWKQLLFLCCGPQEIAYQVKRLVKRNWARIVEKSLSDQEIQDDSYIALSEGNLFELLVWWTKYSIDQSALLAFLKDANCKRPVLLPSQIVENCKIPFARHILTYKKYQCSRCSHSSNNKFLFSVHQSVHAKVLPQIRKSSRVTGKEIQEQSANVLKESIRSGKTENFLRIFRDRKKGRGIRTKREFRRNEFVVEYKGDLITHKEGLELDKKYEKRPSVGCYLYFFEHKNKKWCIDATAETVFKGRLLNHSKLRPNLKTKIIIVDGKIRLCLMALRDIKKGEELTFNYGDNCGSTIEKNPWLKNS